jgi:hypothetical protein
LQGCADVPALIAVVTAQGWPVQGVITPVQAVSSTLGGNQYRIINAGSVTVFLGYGTDGTSANSNAAIITTTGTSIPLLPGTDEILSFVPNAYFTGITASGNATIYITCGDGS